MLGEADAKFPGQQSDAKPPSPSRENPGQVFPKSDPEPARTSTVPGTGKHQESASFTSNPFLLEGSLKRLEQSIGDVINILESEDSSMGMSGEESTFLQNLKSWRNDVLSLARTHGRSAQVSETGGISAEGGGLFTD